jgi:hypothetical protein
MGPIVVLRNRRAGLGGRPGLAPSLAGTLPAPVTLLETTGPEDLAAAAARILDRPPSVLALWGGDGTVTGTLSALIAAGSGRALPPLLLLPGGTVNVIAREVGGRGSARAMLGRLIDRLAKDEAIARRTRTVIRCGGRAGFLFGVGLIPNFHALYNDSGAGGSRRAASVLARLTLDAVWGGRLARSLFVPFGARLTADGRLAAEGTWTNLSAGGIEGLGFGFRPYLRAAELPGGFHWVAHALTPRTAVLELPRVRLGRGISRAEQGVARRVVIELDRSLRWGFDGDTFDAAERLVLEGGLSVELLAP